MHYDQRSIWEVTSVRVEPEPEPEPDEDYREREKYRGRRNASCFSWCPCYPGPTLTGLLLGMLVAGIGFGVLLALYLNRKVDTKLICTTVVTTISSTSTTKVTMAATSTTTTTITSTTTITVLNVNLVVNGDAETGACAMDASTVSPTGWNFSGPIIQISYNNTVSTNQHYYNPGPSDRGQCYFASKAAPTTSMWQTIDLTNRIDPLLIDNQTIRYNLSAWMGGITTQDDNAVVTLTFLDSSNSLVPNCVYLGPVLGNDRSNITSLIYEQANGVVPASTRTILLCVTLNRENGVNNNGNIDNIALTLY